MSNDALLRRQGLGISIIPGGISVARKIRFSARVSMVARVARGFGSDPEYSNGRAEQSTVNPSI